MLLIGIPVLGCSGCSSLTAVTAFLSSTGLDAGRVNNAIFFRVDKSRRNLKLFTSFTGKENGKKELWLQSRVSDLLIEDPSHATIVYTSSPSEAEDSEVPNPQQLQQADTRIDFGAVLPDALSNLKESPHLPKTPRYHADEGSTGKKRPSRYHIKHGNANWFHS